MADVYLWRQCLVLATVVLYSYTVGFMLGYPSVLNQALLSPNSTDLTTTGDHASWIASMNGVGGVLGCFIVPVILHFLGRKAVQISLNIVIISGWIIFTVANNVEALYVARFLQGTANGGVYVNVIIISEYAHPRRRGYFITINKVFIAFGILCCHAMSSVWSWREIAIFAAIPSLLSIAMTFFWPESPSFLALKGRYTECEASFKYMNGNSEESQKHLKLLLEVQMEKNQRKINERNWSVFIKQLLMKDFQIALLIASMLTLALDLCGRYYIMAYLIQIMNDLLGNETSALYFTVGGDLLTIVALSLSAVVIRYLNRRTLLFSFGALATLLMLLISVLVYLKSAVAFSSHWLWFTAIIIILQSFIVNMGVVPASFVIIGEIFPLEHKSLGSCSSGLIFSIFYAAILKVTPILMEHTQLYGTYAIYGVLLAITLIVLYKIVPETKDKPLEEIEDDLNGVTRRNSNVGDRLVAIS